jgi:two-component system, sensor histidine kinase and response regulator
MPGMDGAEATRRIRAKPGGKQPVIIAVTASALEADRIAAMENEMDDFISKPCREDELLEKIRERLGLLHLYAEEDESAPRTDSVQSLSRALAGDLSERLPGELIDALDQAVREGEKSGWMS